MQSRQAEYEDQIAKLLGVVSELHTQLIHKGDILNWITRSRSWRITGWLRRLNFLSLRLLPVFRELKSPSFEGALERPAEVSRISNKLSVRGWVYSTSAPISHVEAFLDTISLGVLHYGSPRLSVASVRNKAHIDCGYEGEFVIDPMFRGRRTLTVRATDCRGHVVDYDRSVEIDVPLDQREIKNVFASFKEESQPAAAFSDVPAGALFDGGLTAAKRLLTSMSKISLEAFFTSNSSVEFPRHENPATSIVLVLYNRAELTLQCLYSILRTNNPAYEVIIVNNASTDDTGKLLKRIKGARIVENEENIHYLRACNQAAGLARGEYLLLLNNDSQLQGDSISTAVETLNSADDIGGVGGKVILPNGTLQEAGSIIWRDGSCLGYGRGDSPFAPAYMFRRDVDYCSAVFFLTRRELFLQENGFDEAYAPAYYEETDYCVRLWKRGLRVVYDPRVAVLHYEFASSSSDADAIELQSRHRRVFQKKHEDWLKSQQDNSPNNVNVAREHRRAGSKRILYLEDRVPHLHHGSGFTRSNRILSELVRMGHSVTCYPMNFPREAWDEVYKDIPPEVEVILDRGRRDIQKFLLERAGQYDLIYVTRSHNLAALDPVLTELQGLLDGVKIVYDAESLFSLREIERLRLEGKKVSPRDEEELVSAEMRLMKNCHSIVSVSESERRELTARGYQSVHLLGHALSASPTPKSFKERKDILFVGAVHDYRSPNADSIIWFVKRVLPRVVELVGDDVNFLVAGYGTSEFLSEYDKGRVKVLGAVDDLTALYNDARMFIVPTRFSAGIPHKAHEAAAHGLPLVATGLIGSQLGWEHQEELLIADDACNFAAACARLYGDEAVWKRLRRNALKRVEEECAPSLFSERLLEIVA
jgi:GT2 family glycosyltransferase